MKSSYLDQTLLQHESLYLIVLKSSRIKIPLHSMARANLNKSRKVLTSTTTASKYIHRRPRISINWNPTFQTQIYLVNSKKLKKLKNFESLRIFFCFTIHKNPNKSCSLEKLFLFLKKKNLVWKKLPLKFYEVRSERGDFNWCWFWAS